MLTSLQIHEAVAKVCPILGVSFVDMKDRKTWRINFAPDASPAQMQAAQDAVAALNLEAPSPPPQTVTPRQARIALLGAGLLPQVEAAVKAAGGPTQITWEYATEFSRSEPLIETLGAALGLTDAQIDALFRVASTL